MTCLKKVERSWSYFRHLQHLLSDHGPRTTKKHWWWWVRKISSLFHIKWSISWVYSTTEYSKNVCIFIINSLQRHYTEDPADVCLCKKVWNVTGTVLKHLSYLVEHFCLLFCYPAVVTTVTLCYHPVLLSALNIKCADFLVFFLLLAACFLIMRHLLFRRWWGPLSSEACRLSSSRKPDFPWDPGTLQPTPSGATRETVQAHSDVSRPVVESLQLQAGAGSSFRY